MARVTWVKLDDGWPNNHKVEPLSDKAKLLYICGLCYCGRNLTDGVLNKKASGIVLAESGASRRHIVELHEAELWDRLEDGWKVHDYLDCNPTREQVLAEREKARKRMKAARSGARSGEPSAARSPSPSRPVKDQEPLARPLDFEAHLADLQRRQATAALTGTGT